MWDRWKTRIKRLFTDDDDNIHDSERLRHSQHRKRDIQAKMIYQYPDEKAFRFPIIPDHEEKETIDIPAFKRRQKRLSVSKDLRNYKPDRQVDYRKQMEESDKHKTPFRPSRVASPIYGYQPRPNQSVDNVPAYMRKETKRQNQLSVTPATSQETPTASDVPEHVDKRTTQATTHLSVEQRTPKLKPDRHRKQRKRSRKTEQKPIPFNVMMTENDKRNYAKTTRSKTKTQRTKTTDDHFPLHLLNDTDRDNKSDDKWLSEQQALLEKTLTYFKVRADVVNATQGPTVTRFEVQPELGVKVSKIKNLSDDIKLNMAAKDIRIEAPIPGKHTIGIEVPNPKPKIVGLRDIYDTEAFQNNPAPLAIGLGVNIEGKPLITNIQKMPHGLIAGATGSGKSVCINTILISLIYKSSHQDVKFLLIDPKTVELAPYNGIPHLLSPVITDVKAATVALKRMVNEMEDRYRKLAEEGVRDIDKYNQKMIKNGRDDDKMPYIVIVIDELADLMMVSPQDVEDAICRIAQKARACGIHLLVATQRPSVDVITGLIKANIPTRIAFSVSSQADSRTIIDTNGAEKLLGKGDMLFIENGAAKITRLQGAFVSDEEIERITDYARSQAEPDYAFEQTELLKKLDHGEEDELLPEAIAFVVEKNQASTSLLQRQFRIGYNRAARLMDDMERQGIISGQNGSKPRDVLVTKAQLEDRYSEA
ncbi:MAG TPA: DNA translocase FtsK [Bacillota bacterium]|nr:DNA translocase FtsK [Bacillota bacterium]